MHPNLMTIGADLLILPEHNQKSGGKQVVIPVLKQFMIKVVPYFQAEFGNESANWREMKEKNKILTVTKSYLKTNFRQFLISRIYSTNFVLEFIQQILLAIFIVTFL